MIRHEVGNTFCKCSMCKRERKEQSSTKNRLISFSVIFMVLANVLKYIFQNYELVWLSNLLHLLHLLFFGWIFVTMMYFLIKGY